ncbi:hypothetical protein HL658_15625 [Azospirillum sp. RWY-5-1]|uniref:SWIM-type domain-containing protein n=1 Tax=Azospirillum oleiclasticum TaxID=2735135 RepID=A0ABX2T9F9_9PROT|nr:SWIM zinc finger family protein [Azospirillum oleiclasticum]NYZ13985.1 hypothetical protein [Azospirillum oleiclasticum]NYZ20908.1 hypothetical protein [Azospirillum oleiclasticum]
MPRRTDDDDDDGQGWRYPVSKPKTVTGGIKAANRRGDFATSWWGRRWLEVLHSFQIGARLTRGRGYARKGQVLDLSVGEGKVTARVQGSRPRPYAVTITLKSLAAKERARVQAALAADVAGAARLLAGEMPETLEDSFHAAGVALFPARLDDLKTGCTCPDWSNPCKHVAAVYCLLAEAFDRDPFLLLTLRGLPRDVVLAGLEEGEGAPAAEPVPPQPLSAEAVAFWRGGTVPADLVAVAAPADGGATLLDSLGPVPFWRGETDAAPALGRALEAAARRAAGIGDPADREGGA